MAGLRTCPHCRGPVEDPKAEYHVGFCEGPLCEGEQDLRAPQSAPGAFDGSLDAGEKSAARGQDDSPEPAAETLGSPNTTNAGGVLRSCPNSTCGAELANSDRRCVFCGTELTPALQLRFPAGDVRISDFPLVIGRDPAASPVAELCCDHENVSRIHAELLLVDGRPHARDGSAARPSSTNGTFLNGEPLGRQPVPLHAGDSLRLASDVEIEVADG
jgi:hypothetical protein